MGTPALTETELRHTLSRIAEVARTASPNDTLAFEQIRSALQRIRAAPWADEVVELHGLEAEVWADVAFGGRRTAQVESEVADARAREELVALCDQLRVAATQAMRLR